GALILLGWVLMYWFSAWPSLRPALAAPPAANVIPEPGTIGSSANDLFGIAQRESDSTAATAVAIHLLGVVADAGGRKGYAVLRVDEKQIVAVPQGEEVAPGVVLAEVHPHHVVLERSGSRETIALPEANASMVSPVLPESGMTAELSLSQAGEW
ncbi:MAG TPA: type II secretion system protein N, partial [Nitrosospira sp.]